MIENTETPLGCDETLYRTWTMLHICIRSVLFWVRSEKKIHSQWPYVSNCEKEKFVSAAVFTL